MNQSKTLLAGLFAAASLCAWSPALLAQEVITSETVQQPGVVEQHSTTTTTTTEAPRKLTHDEKEHMERERKFEHERAEADKEYREKMHDAAKDYRDDVKDDLDD